MIAALHGMLFPAAACLSLKVQRRIGGCSFWYDVRRSMGVPPDVGVRRTASGVGSGREPVQRPERLFQERRN